MDIFVTGGSGFVGGHLIERLVRDGHRVRALARSDRSAATVQGWGAEVVRGDLGSVSAEDLAGADAVIHAAARAEDWGPREAFEEVNVRGTERMLEAARGAGVGRFVLVSTEAVLFDGDDLLDVDEAASVPAEHRFPYPATKAAAERLVLAANSEALTTVSIRPRLVWGPRDATVLPAVLEMVRDGGWWWLDGGRHQTSTCHVHNLVEALVLALDHGEGGRAYFVTDGEDRTMRDLLTQLAATEGVDLPGRSLPGWLGRGLAAGVEGAWNLLGREGKPPMTRFAITMMSASVTVRDERARAELGYRPVVAFDEGVRALAG